VVWRACILTTAAVCSAKMSSQGMQQDRIPDDHGCVRIPVNLAFTGGRPVRQRPGSPAIRV
jgi:hypothetical protein